MPTQSPQKPAVSRRTSTKKADTSLTVVEPTADEKVKTMTTETKKTTKKPAARKDAAAKSHLSAKEISHFQQLLIAERARLEEEREQIRGRSGTVDNALPEEGEGGDDDTADLASAMMDKEMDLSVEDEIEDMLSSVDHALKKIADNTYGICDMSGQTIPASRLELIPWAALTVECQAIAEGE